MKEKLVLVLAILLMAAPAMATVNFVAADAGNGQLRISYSCDDGELPRGVALKVTLTGNGGHVTDADGVLSTDADYNTYIDYANSNPVAYAIGDGHPLADPAGAGVASFPATEFSICMGVLDEAGNQDAGPGSTTDLITIQLHADTTGPVTVTVDADYSRAPNGGNGGGAVGSTLATNLPLTAIVVADVPEDPSAECMMETHPDYAMWESYGKPDCWCYEAQTNGDVDGLEQLGGAVNVYTNDLAIFLPAFGTLQTTAPGVCADIDHLTQLGGAVNVYTNDLAVFLPNFGTKQPAGDDTYINFWIVPTP